ncbi:MAG: hypothetical protein QW606_04830 [Conexivisphaerales archaeon]
MKVRQAGSVGVDVGVLNNIALSNTKRTRTYWRAPQSTSKACKGSYPVRRIAQRTGKRYYLKSLGERSGGR